jgi:hypothetical protein
LNQNAAGYGAFANRFAGHITLSEAVNPAGVKTLTTADGELQVTDGAPLQGKQEFGALYVIDCRDIDDAIAILKRNPSVEYGTVELWECVGPVLPPVDDRYEDEEKLDAYMQKHGVVRHGKTEQD